MLYIVATPIGNLDDMSPRGVQVFRDVDVIACEDTRRTWALLSYFNIPRPASFISYRQGNELSVGRKLVSMLESGREVALCSDGGFPGISDPGYRLICLAIEHNIEIRVIPGASSVIVALLSSGLSTSSFTFKGYPPRKSGAMKKFFKEEENNPHTLIIFESSLRVRNTLKVALDVYGNRKVAVCSELTKKFERVLRGYLYDLCNAEHHNIQKGEVTIVIAGNNSKFSRDLP